MKKAFSTLLLLLVASVAMCTNYFVRNGGSDGANGLTNGTAWATVAKVNGFAFSAGDSIFFDATSDWLYQPLIPTWSGNSGAHIYVGTYNGTRHPRITGGQHLTSWTSIGGGKYTATVSSATSRVKMITINDSIHEMGRWPDTGFKRYQTSAGTNNRLVDTALAGTSYADGFTEVLTWLTENFEIDRYTISAQNNDTLSFVRANGYGTNSATGGGVYYLQNNSLFLNDFGEFSYNDTTKLITVYFGAANPNDYTIVAATTTAILNLNNVSYIDFANIQFDMANGKNGNLDDVWVGILNCTGGTNHINFNNVQCYRGAGGGLMADATTSYINFRYGHIEDVSDMGVFFIRGDHKNITHSDVVRVNLRTGFSNNSLYGYGIWAFGDAGADLHDSVAYNYVTYTGYLGVRIERSNYITVLQNDISFNDSTRMDGGGFYAYGFGDSSAGISTATNRLIKGNYIHDLVLPLSEPMYLDDNSSGFTIDSNMLVSTQGGIVCQNCYSTTITRNVVISTGTNDAALNLKENGKSVVNMHGLDIHGNTFIMRDINKEVVYVQSGSNLPGYKGYDNIAGFGTIYDNTYIRPVGSGQTVVLTDTRLWDDSSFTTLTARQYNYSVAGLNDRYGYEVGGSFGAVTRNAYIISAYGSNVHTNYQFNSNVSNAHSGSLSSSLPTWDNTNVIDGGSLKTSFSPQIFPHDYSTVYLDIAHLNAPPYVVRFKSVSTDFTTLRVGLSATDEPPSLNPANDGLAGTDAPTSETQHEVYLPAAIDATFGKCLICINKQTSTPIWIDNLEVIPVTATTITSTAAYITTLQNDSSYARYLPLSTPSRDVQTATLYTDSALVNGKTAMVLLDTAGNVVPANEPPTADAGGDATITYPTVTTPLDGTGSTDGDGTIVTYAWSIISGSGGSILDAADPTTTFTGTPNTTYVVRLTVTDNEGATDVDNKTIIVNKAANVITFGALADKTVGDAPFSLTATASSGLTVSYASSNTSVITISGSTATIVGAGTSNITASQAGNGNYNAATPVVQPQLVNPAVGDTLRKFYARQTTFTGRRVSFRREASSTPIPPVEPPLARAVEDRVVFSTARDFRADYGIVGDSVNITTQLQSAFDSLGIDFVNPVLNMNTTGVEKVYTLTSPIYLRDKDAIKILAWNCKFVWLGHPDSSMFVFDGVRYCTDLLTGATLDGKNACKILIEQSSTTIFDTDDQYKWMTFMRATNAIKGGFTRAGTGGIGFADIDIMNCIFRTISNKCIWVGNFNALNIRAIECLFEDNYICLSNQSGLGNLDAFSCVFKRSTYADIALGATSEGFNFINNYSYQANKFLEATFSANPVQIHLQRNIILDAGGTPVNISNFGAVVSCDNVIRNNPSFTHWAFFLPPYNRGDFISICDTSNLDEGVHDDGGMWARKIIIDSSKRDFDSINPAEPTLASLPEPTTATIFEATASISDLAMQAKLDSAEAAYTGGVFHIVHAEYGSYSNDTTWNIPAHVRLIGDGHKTRITWTGAAYAYSMTVGSKSVIQDILISGASKTSNGILVDDADAITGRVFMDNVEMQFNKTCVWTDSLANTKVIARNSGYAYSDSVALIAVGNNTMGFGQNIYYGVQGASVTKQLTVSNNAVEYFGKGWVETSTSGASLGTATGGGELDVNCMRIAYESTGQPTLTVSGYNGKVALIGDNITDSSLANGSGTGMKFAAIGTGFRTPPYIKNNTSPAGDISIISSIQKKDTLYESNPASGVQIPDAGDSSSAKIKDMMVLSRSILPPYITTNANGIPSVVLRGVRIEACRVGVKIRK